MISGRHPPAGFTPSFLYRALISSFIGALRGSRRLYFLYFSWMALICGATRCIFNIDFIDVMRSGSNNRLINNVCSTMAHPQPELQPENTWLCVHFSQMNNGLAMMP